MARFYANENFPYPVVEELRRLGHDVLTIQETGGGGQAIEDAEVLAFAIREKRTILTLNRKHFIHLHNQNPTHSGIIVTTFDPDFVRHARRIHESISAKTSLENELLRVNRPQI